MDNVFGFTYRFDRPSLLGKFRKQAGDCFALGVQFLLLISDRVPMLAIFLLQHLYPGLVAFFGFTEFAFELKPEAACIDEI